MSRDIKLSALRLPVDLHAKIVAASRENSRSQHAEMLHRMDQSFEEQPVVDDAVVQQVFNAVATKVITEVFTTCFNRLEERVAAMLDHPMRHIYSVSIPSDNSDISTEDMARMLKETHFPDYEFPLRRGTTSPTGRLSESQPELQDLPVLSGMNTLASSLRAGRMHCGGYTGDLRLKDGEIPAILLSGQPAPAPAVEGEWIENTGDEPEGVTDKSILDFKLSIGSTPVLGHHYLQGSSKGAAIWRIEGHEQHVTHWRHSAYNRQRTFAEHVAWAAPKSPDQAVAEQLS